MFLSRFCTFVDSERKKNNGSGVLYICEALTLTFDTTINCRQAEMEKSFDHSVMITSILTIFIIGVAGTWEEHNGKLYLVLKDHQDVIRETWEKAVVMCEKEDATLFSPTARMNSWTIDFLRRNRIENGWIGINDKCTEGNWIWSDGSPVNEIDWQWAKGKPCDSHDNNITCSNDTSFDNLYCDGQLRMQWSVCKPDCRPGPADILFMVDTSSSTKGHLNRIIYMMTYIVTKLPIGPKDFQIALMKYSYNPTLVFNFAQYTNVQSITSGFDDINISNGPTYTGKALQKADEIFYDKTSGSRISAYKYIILIYDGLSSDRMNTISEANKMRDKRIKISSVGIGNAVAHEEIVNTAYSEHYAFNHIHLDDIYNQLIQDSIDVSCTVCVRETEADIIILLDVQKNQSNIEFQYRHKAIEKFLKGLNNDGSNKRVGMVAYSDHADYIFKLSWLNNVDKLIGNANNVDLDKVSVISNLSHTLQFVGVDAFSSSNGGRPSSRKIVMMFSSLTSGYSAEMSDQMLNLNKSDIEVLGVATGHDEVNHYTEILLDPSQLLVISEDSHSDPFDCLKALSAMTSYYMCDDTVFQLYP
ncbi:collagen alpha-4(VI) chain-like isoform X2 [Mytilus californianus]|uniref:collagen alpha-4(VI) chain-like isoform X2 n=1 Tax=Mytilus californianus TaxID=6549 RepID=UPI002245A901|nr:collagen alpha-4(VI) chain-like isoform X2 [Mytilus californianus]